MPQSEKSTVQTGAYRKIAVPGADCALFIGLMTRMQLAETDAEILLVWDERVLKAERVAAVFGD